MRLTSLALAATATLMINPAQARTPWCGLYMMKYFGKSDSRLALAREWSREGTNAGGPGAGVVAVWPHHVGVLVGQDAQGNWLLHSGNDGNAVRTRPRSLSGVIAFRNVGSGGYAVSSAAASWHPEAPRHPASAEVLPNPFISLFMSEPMPQAHYRHRHHHH
jgi:hypothetical protein